MITDQYLTLKEVRERLAVSRATLWRWINERGLRVVKVGDITRIRQSALDEFVAKHERVQSGSAPKEAEKCAA